MGVCWVAKNVLFQVFFSQFCRNSLDEVHHILGLSEKNELWIKVTRLCQGGHNAGSNWGRGVLGRVGGTHTHTLRHMIMGRDIWGCSEKMGRFFVRNPQTSWVPFFTKKSLATWRVWFSKFSWVRVANPENLEKIVCFAIKSLEMGTYFWKNP